MLGSRTSLIICIVLLALLAPSLHIVLSQPGAELQPRFSLALAKVREAESAGATRGETAGLVLQLNEALRSDEEATGLTAAGDSQRRAQLIAQANRTLDEAESQASRLQVVASQRTFYNRVVSYVLAAIGAFIVTLAYALGVQLRRRYRVRRTFEMRIFPK